MNILNRELFKMFIFIKNQFDLLLFDDLKFFRSDIEKEIQENQEQAVFYVGNRKQTVAINEEVKTVIEVVDEVYQQEAEA